jgi:arginyl-tRNA--protein-N-Asp/Glu arginylyltransferase
MNQKNVDFGEGLLKDALNHIESICLPLWGCKTCLSTRIYALAFILSAQKGFVVNEFKSRAEHISEGLFLFLQKKLVPAMYVILPQLDGIVTEHLIAKRLLKKTNGYPKWTNLTENSGKNCTNIKDAIEQGITNKHCMIGKNRFTLGIYKSKLDEEKILETIRRLRNDILHGSLLKVKDHEAASAILVLMALHHDLALPNFTTWQKAET